MASRRSKLTDAQAIEDRLLGFEAAAELFEEKGGNGNFLEYAWNLSVVAADPTWIIKEKGSHARGYRDSGNRDLGELKKRARSLAKLRSSMGDEPAFKMALEAQEQLVAKAKHRAEAAFYAEMGMFPRRGPTVMPRRYVFFGAVWPYMTFKGMGGSDRWRWEWLSDWFNIDDATEPVDQRFLRDRFKQRGFPFGTVKTARFNLFGVRREDRQHETARQWWGSAKGGHKAFLKNVAAATNAYLLWKRRIRMTPEELWVFPVKYSSPSSADRAYAKQAWNFLGRDLPEALRGLPDRFPVRDLAR